MAIKKIGRLYGVGVGPGDPELITLKAYRILSQVPIIFVPQKGAESESYARSIINPGRKHRKHQLAEAREILLGYREGATPVGMVSNAYRPGQQVIVTDLDRMLDSEVGMTTTIIIGNSATFTFGDWMVTPRGYRAKYRLHGD